MTVEWLCVRNSLCANFGVFPSGMVKVGIEPDIICTMYSENLRIRTYNFSSQPNYVLLYLVFNGNEAVQVLKMVLFFFRTF